MTLDKIFDTIPDGWRVLKGATVHPKGLIWITDGRSMFDPDHRIALWKKSTSTPEELSTVSQEKK